MIKVKNLSVFYEDKKILNNISFQLKKGDSLCIIGANGSGKTTLLKAISKIINFEGEVFINNISTKYYSSKDLAKKVALLTQKNTSFYTYKVYDIIMMGRYPYSNFKNKFSNLELDKKIVEKIIKSLNIESIKNRYMNTLSDGQIQKVFIAKALAQETDILLLDEPNNSLDLVHQINLLNFLKEWGKGRNFIAVLHDINLAIMLAENIMILDEGKLIYFGNVKELFKTDILEKVYKIDIKEFMHNLLKKWEQFL